MSEENNEYVIDENVDVQNIESWKIDKAIEEVKENNEDIKRYKEILDQRKMELDAQFEAKKESITKRNHFLLTTLNSYAKTQKLSNTKTQKKYKSLAGDIVIKKSIPKVSKPAKDKTDDIEKVYPEFIEKVENKKVKWKDLKSKFIIQSDKIYDKESGEDVTGLFEIEVNDEETIVK